MKSIIISQNKIIAIKLTIHLYTVCFLLAVAAGFDGLLISNVCK